TTVLDVEPGKQLQGKKTYRMTYTVEGLLAPATDGVTLTWTTVSGWSVPVKQVDISVIGRKQPRHVSCNAGAPGSTMPCTLAQAGGEGVIGGKFLQNDLPAGGVFDIRVGFPKDVAKAKPLLEKRHTLATAF